VFSIPLENAFVLPGIGTIGRMVGFVAFAVGMLSILESEKVRSITPVHFLMIAFVSFASLTYFWSADPGRTTVQALTYLQLLVMVWLVWNLAPRFHDQLRLMQAYLLGTGVYAIGTILQGANSSANVAQRYAAFSINPNEAGLRLALSVPLGIYLATIETRRIRVWLYRLHLALAVWALLLTGSRGALIALVAALLMIPLSFRKWSLRQKVAALAIIAIVAFTAATLVPAAEWRRLGRTGTEISQGTMNKRTIIWHAGVNVFLEHPFFGVGAGAFAPSVQPEMAFEWVAHNTFLSILVEQGVIGFGVFLLLLVMMIFGALRLPSLERTLWIVMLLSWAVGVSAMTWESSKPTWFLFGLLTANIYALSGAVRQGSRRPSFPQCATVPEFLGTRPSSPVRSYANLRFVRATPAMTKDRRGLWESR
jgi:O-antigen ligase